MYLDAYFNTQMTAATLFASEFLILRHHLIHFSKVHTISMFELIIYQFSFIVGGPVPSSWVANAE